MLYLMIKNFLYFNKIDDILYDIIQDKRLYIENIMVERNILIEKDHEFNYKHFVASFVSFLKHVRYIDKPKTYNEFMIMIRSMCDKMMDKNNFDNFLIEKYLVPAMNDDGNISKYYAVENIDEVLVSRFILSYINYILLFIVNMDDLMNNKNKFINDSKKEDYIKRYKICINKAIPEFFNKKQ